MRAPKIIFSLIILVLVGCRLHHHEQMTPNWTNNSTNTSLCDTTGADLVLEGTYQGQDLYVQNPFLYCTDSVVRLCAYAVTVNDTISMPRDSITQSCFRIPLTTYGFTKGDPLHVIIRHYSAGMPKVLNPEVR